MAPFMLGFSKINNTAKMEDNCLKTLNACILNQFKALKPGFRNINSAIPFHSIKIYLYIFVWSIGLYNLSKGILQVLYSHYYANL